MASTLLCLALPAWGQLPPRSRSVPVQPLPLGVGNQWIYVERGRFAAEQPVTVEVKAASVQRGSTYYQLTGFASEDAWVRYNALGELVALDPAGGPDRLWYAFGAPEGFSWRPQLPEACLDQARLASRTAEVRVPAGAFRPSILIQYNPGPCADAGFSEEAFALGIGLLRRTAITIAGPRTLELAFARIDGVALTVPEVHFSLAIDRPRYSSNLMPIPVLTARLTIRNTSALPLTLDFSSGQRYDLAIRDSAGRQVYLWSEGKAFILVLGRLELSPGEQVYLVEVPLADRNNRPFAAGRYTLEAWLTTVGGKAYSATIPFELQ